MSLLAAILDYRVIIAIQLRKLYLHYSNALFFWVWSHIIQFFVSSLEFYTSKWRPFCFLSYRPYKAKFELVHRLLLFLAVYRIIISHKNKHRSICLWLINNTLPITVTVSILFTKCYGFTENWQFFLKLSFSSENWQFFWSWTIFP